MAQGRKEPPKENLQAIADGVGLLRKHPLFAALLNDNHWAPSHKGEPFTPKGYVRLRNCQTRYWGRADPFDTVIEVNPWKRAPAEERAHVLAQAVLHLYFCHADGVRKDDDWRIACEVVGEEFLRALNIGRRPEALIALRRRHWAAMSRRSPARCERVERSCGRSMGLEDWPEARRPSPMPTA